MEHPHPPLSKGPRPHTHRLMARFSPMGHHALLRVWATPKPTGDNMTRAGLSSFDVKWYALRRKGCSGLPMGVENATAPLWALHGYLLRREPRYLYGALATRLRARVTP
jgi:hypothetical protein